MNEKYVQVTIIDKEALSKYLTDMKGINRTMQQYAADCGITASTLSRILRQKIKKPLSSEILQKLYENRSKDCSINFEQLARANGMVSESKYDEFQMDKMLEDVFLEVKEQEEQDAKIQKLFMDALFERGKMLRLVKAPTIIQRATKESFGLMPNYDFIIISKDEGMPEKWVFTLLTDEPAEDQKNSAESLVQSYLNNKLSSTFLLDAWRGEEKPGLKYSFVFWDEEIYKTFRYLLADAPLNNEMTTILIDGDASKIIKEEWLGCPQANETKSLFNTSNRREDDQNEEGIE